MFLALCDDEPKIITKITPEVSVHAIGEDAVLKCYLDNPDNYTISWVKANHDNPSDQTLLAFGTKLTVQDPRFIVTATEDSLVLQIKNLKSTDSAVYQCQAIVSTEYKDIASVDLLIKHAPKIIKVKQNPAVLGSSVELNCTANGYPTPNISWKRADDRLLPIGGNIFNGTILRINDVSYQDRGVYYCIADNGIEHPDQHTINFEVEFPPKITSPRPRVAQALDYDIELQCKIEAFPAPEISWLKDDTQILDEGVYRYVFHILFTICFGNKKNQIAKFH